MSSSRLERYRAEAKNEPFVVELDDGTLLVAGRRPFDDLIHLGDGGTRAVVRRLFDAAADQLLAAVVDDDYDVLNGIVDDALEHLGAAQAARLAWLLDRYGEAIEADLVGKVDVLDLWRGDLTPRALLNLIDHLPRASHYQEALAQDDEVVAGMVDTPAGQSKPPPLTEFTPEVEALAVVVDRLADLINTTVSAGGSKPKQIPRYPRPVTAADRLKAAHRRAAMDDLEQKLFRPSEAP